MRINSIILFIISIVLNINSQEWVFNTGTNEFTGRALPLSNGNFLFRAGLASGNTTSGNVYIIDPNGNIVYDNNEFGYLDGTSNFIERYSLNSYDGNFLFISGIQNCLKLKKLSPDGDLIEEYEYQSNRYNTREELHFVNNELICFYSSTNDPFASNLILIKINEDGEKYFEKELTINDFENYTNVYGFQYSKFNDEYYFLWYRDNGSVSGDCRFESFLSNYNSDFELQWVKPISKTSLLRNSRGFCITNNEQIVIGNSDSEINFLMIYDLDGNFIKNINSSEYDDAGIADVFYSNNLIYTTGAAIDQPDKERLFWTMILDENLNILIDTIWGKRDCSLGRITKGFDNEIYSAGYLGKSCDAPFIDCYDIYITELNRLLPTTSTKPLPINEVKIYPNPTHSLININAEKDNYESLTIYSFSGQEVYNSQLESDIIDIEFLSPGSYLLVLRDKNGQYKKSRITKL